MGDVRVDLGAKPFWKAIRTVYVHENTVPFFFVPSTTGQRIVLSPSKSRELTEPGLVIITTIGDCLYSLIASLSQTQTKEGKSWD